jgi:hypothetical protein
LSDELTERARQIRPHLERAAKESGLPCPYRVAIFDINRAAYWVLDGESVEFCPRTEPFRE